MQAGHAGIEVFVALAGRLVLEVLSQVAHRPRLFDRLAVGRDLGLDEATQLLALALQRLGGGVEHVRTALAQRGKAQVESVGQR